MLLLNKITTQYNELEDRIELAGDSENNPPLTLWLSQRILLRLLPPIIDWAEKVTVGERNLTETDSSLVQDFAQQHANENLKPQLPVGSSNNDDQKAVPPPSLESLVHEINITKSSSFIQLTLKSKRIDNALLQLNNIQIRQWLAIIYLQWIKADWKDFGWPLWIKAPNEKPSGDIH